MRRRHSALYVVLALVGAALACGCTSVSALFSTEFLSALGMGTQAVTLPGDAPAILVEVEDQTQRNIEVVVSYLDADGLAKNYTVEVEPGQKTGQAIICPMSEITVGALGDLSSVGAIVRLGAGGAADPYIEVEPFGALLQEGINYECGDAITFSVVPSSATLSGYQIYASIRAGGAGS